MKPIHMFVCALYLLSLCRAERLVQGLVEPYRDVLLSAAVPGRIASLPFREGDRVEEGAVLLLLESRVEELEVERRRSIFENQTELQAARERETLLREELESTRALAERTGSVSRDELNRKQLETVLAGLEVARLELTRERERIEMEMARERLAQQRVTAPFAGVVAQLPLDEGESVQANQPSIRLVDDAQAFLVVNIPAEQARRLRVGQPVSLRFPLAEMLEKTGKVDFLSPVVDPASGLRRVRLLFENAEPKVEPGVSGQWIVDGGAHE